MSQPSHPPVPNTGSDAPTINRPTRWAWWAEPEEIKARGQTILVGGASLQDGPDIAALVVLAHGWSADVTLTLGSLGHLEAALARVREALTTPVDGAQ